MSVDTGTGRAADRHEDAVGARRFGAHSVLALALTVGGSLLFLTLWLLVARQWPPLAAVDGAVAADLNAAVSGSPRLVEVLRLVTDLGGTGTAALVLTLATVFLLVRARRRLALFVAVTGLGTAVLVPVTKALADRARPLVGDPVVAAPSNASFPSGHAMTSLVTWGVLALLALPALRRWWRPWLVAAAVLVTGAVGITRLALGVHFVSDVLAGWVLGAAWLAATTAAFRGWQHEAGPPVDEPLDPLDVPPGEAPRWRLPGRDRAPALRPATTRLVAGAALLLAALSGLGLLVTGPLSGTALGRVDRTVVAAVVGARSDDWTRAAELVGALGGTRVVIAGGLVLAVLAVAVTGSRRPAAFVVVTLAGEALLYGGTALVVGRMRPEVADLTSGLPTGASWPSGHVAAAAALSGALAVLVVRSTRHPARWAVLALPLLVAPAVAVARIYVAAHHPSDVLAGLLLGGVWVVVCASVLLPPTDADGETP